MHLSDYGGALSPLHLIEDPLNLEYQTNHASVDSRNKYIPAPTVELPETLNRRPSSVLIPPRSFLNPFFGYHTIASVSRPHILRPTRRRKRDLLLTLSILWWKRWGTHVVILLYFLIAFSLRKTIGRGVARWMTRGNFSSSSPPVNNIIISRSDVIK